MGGPPNLDPKLGSCWKDRGGCYAGDMLLGSGMHSLLAPSGPNPQELDPAIHTRNPASPHMAQNIPKLRSFCSIVALRDMQNPVRGEGQLNDRDETVRFNEVFDVGRLSANLGYRLQKQ